MAASSIAIAAVYAIVLTPPALHEPVLKANADNLPAAVTASLSEPVEAPESGPAPEPSAEQPVATATDDASGKGNTDRSDIVVTGQNEFERADPVAEANEISFAAVQAVDDKVVAPVAHGYKKGLPRPVRKGVHNFLTNLDEPIVFLNFLLQFKIGKAFETAGRFAINSTVGVGGVLDVAKNKPFNLPHRPNGLAHTLGYYGVGSGPYLFLPLIGSTSLRDVTGRVIDLAILPAAVGKPLADPAVALARGTVSAIDQRAEQDDVLTELKKADNHYAAMREYYIRKRQAEIDVLRGKRTDAEIPLTEIKAFTISGRPYAEVRAQSDSSEPVEGAETPAPVATDGQ